MEPLFIVLEEIAQAHEKTIAQVALNWLIGKEEYIIPIPGARNVRQAQELAEKLIVRPTLHHFGIATGNLEAMLDWYGKVVGTVTVYQSARPWKSNPDAYLGAAFVTNDPAHHRIAINALPGLKDDTDRYHAKIQHVAFEYQTIDDLLNTYTRLKGLSIEPVIAMDHGPSIAFYYADPDAAIVQQYPDRFRAFAAPPLLHIDEALAETRRCLDELGMVGVAVTTSVLKRPLSDPSFEPFFAELDRRGTALVLHPALISIDAIDGGFDLSWIIGSPFEDTVVVLQLILSGFLARYPSIKIIVPHLGGTLPFLMARIDHQVADLRKGQLQEKPGVLARRLWYDTVAHGNTPVLYCTCATFGADRLIFGSDYPAQLDDWYRSSVTFIEDAQLAAEEKRAILDQTSTMLFGL